VAAERAALTEESWEGFMNIIQQYLTEHYWVLENLPVPQLFQLLNVLREARDNKKMIFLMGNGGSASTASHFVCDLGKNTYCEGGPPFRVIGLSDNIPAMLAYANDDGYEHVFAHQLSKLVSPGDVVIGISGSGNSKNVLNAMEVANNACAYTVGFTGFDGGKLGQMVDLNLWVQSSSMEQVEDIHLMMEHIIVKALREEPTPVNLYENIYLNVNCDGT
jgi:D-sedoheptulose 7-phosphate isomerase